MRQVRQALFEYGGTSFVDDVEDGDIIVAGRSQHVKQKAYFLEKQKRHLPRDRPRMTKNQECHALDSVKHICVTAPVSMKA